MLPAVCATRICTTALYITTVTSRVSQSIDSGMDTFNRVPASSTSDWLICSTSCRLFCRSCCSIMPPLMGTDALSIVLPPADHGGWAEALTVADPEHTLGKTLPFNAGTTTLNWHLVIILFATQRTGAEVIINMLPPLKTGEGADTHFSLLPSPPLPPPAQYRRDGVFDCAFPPPSQSFACAQPIGPTLIRKGLGLG